MNRPPPEEPGAGSPARGGPADPERAGSGTRGPAAGEERVPPAPEVREFLIRLGQGAQKHGFYPAGHPALEPIVEDVMEGLGSVLDDRDRISLGVTPDRVIVEETETDPDQPVLSSLADRLHRHELARVSFLEGVEAAEVSAFLEEVSGRAEEIEESLGARVQVADEWPHVTVEPVRYERFSMAEEAADRAGVEEVEDRAEELWAGLARSALTEETLEELGEEGASLDRMVAALEEFSADTARAREAAARMLALAEGLDREGPDAAPEVRDRFVELLREMDPAALGRLLRSADPEQRQRFLDATTQWLPAGTVVELLEQVADTESLDLSFQMLRLVSKLASYVDADPAEADPAADAAFREQVQRLVSGWGRNIRGGEGHRDLDRIAGTVAGVGPGTGSFVDPERVVQTALEAGTLGPAGAAAVDEMLEEDRTDRVLDLVRGAPADTAAADAVWERLGTGEVLRGYLAGETLDFDALDDLVERMGGRAAGPLLDALSEAGSRSVRGQLFSRLEEMEGEVVPEILDRLEDDRWFVQRNMLALLDARPRRPDDFSALPFTRHPEAPVRREAYKLAFADPGDRPEALVRALRDEDRQCVHLGIAALEDARRETLDELVPLIEELLDRPGLSDGMLRPAIRALGRADREEALDVLTGLCSTRKMWRFWTTELAEKSPRMLAALRALAQGWAGHSAARRILEAARSSGDRELRAAAGAGGESP